jgi:transcriptional regulator with XRE-family HTH domain
MSDIDYTEQLQVSMQHAGIDSLSALCQLAGISRRQLLKIRRGELKQVKTDTIIKLSQVLNISLDHLIQKFSPHKSDLKTSNITDNSGNNFNSVVTETVVSQPEKQLLLQEFQQSCLEILESLLLQFPTAAYKARENPQLPAVNILPLIEKPLERLLQAWGIEAIAQVAEEVAYNPQLHQPMTGNISPNQIVKVRYVGYQQQGKLLYRAKVSPTDCK